MTTNRYSQKIAKIRGGGYAKGDFIIADAKDADVTGGVTATGARRDDKARIIGHRTREEYLAQMEDVIAQDEVDILLASAGNLEALQSRGAFKSKGVQPAFRANETTDVWGNIRGGRYADAPSRPYRGANLSFAPADLCLYSITFNNDVDTDVEALEAYAAFRKEAIGRGLKHFLEVFNPNAPDAVNPEETGSYVNDCIIRLLASLTIAERPEFLKVAYDGPQALQELADHDPSLVVGILGGAGATHRDTFELIAQAERHGARVALFGRKINQAENQCCMIGWMRRVANQEVGPREAVRGYHADLKEQGMEPDRPIDDDLKVTAQVLRFDAEAG